jgi:hypothetical protein
LAPATRLPPTPAPPSIVVGRANIPVVVRPTAIKIIAWAGIVHAVMIFMGLIMTLMRFTGQDRGVDHAVDAVRNSPFLIGWTLGTSVAAAVLALLLVLAAFAALSLRKWSRKALVVWAASWIALNVAELIVDCAVAFPAIAKLNSGSSLPPNVELAAATMSLVLGVLWPAYVAWYLRRADIKSLFNRAGGARLM